MTDTKRTLSDLLTSLFADGQAAGSISPNDMRDLLVSLGQAPHGALSLQHGAEVETEIDTQDVFKKAAGATTLASQVLSMDMPANNRLRYTGTPTRWFTIDVSISVISASAAKVFAFFINKNGSQEATSEINHKHVIAADVLTVSMTHHLQLATNDYVEVFLENNTDSSNLTLNKMIMTAQGILE